MLIKKILAALPLSPAPKRLPRHAGVCAGAAVHHAGRCGDVLAVDVYSRKRELLYRFYSDGRNYITRLQHPFSTFAKPGWTKRNPTESHIYSLPDDIAANPASIAAVEEVLGRVADWRGDNSKIGCAIQMFIYRVNQERRDRARERKRALQKAHFAMFPEYPADLAAFCEDRVFQSSVLYVSKLKKTLANGQVSGERRAVCRHCGKSFQVGREVKPGGSGICPKCGHPVIYRAGWLEKEVTHKVKICIAYKVDGQLLLRYVDVERIIYPDRKEPQYRFSDCFKTLFLTVNGKPIEYAYAWCQAPYYGYDWRRLRCGTECLGDSYVYTSNLREVFGERYYNVDLQAGLSSCGVKAEKLTSWRSRFLLSRRASISSLRKVCLQYALNSHLVCHSNCVGFIFSPPFIPGGGLVFPFRLPSTEEPKFCQLKQQTMIIFSAQRTSWRNIWNPIKGFPL